MGVEIPASESLESPKAENEIVWKKTTDQTGFAYSGKNTFKSGEGEFTTVGQGDSFAGSHAYLLLTDVPGASANSGATITAANSEGKQAFVAAETRTGGEEEVAVGAGTEFKTILDQAGKSEFLQLTTSAKRKINRGSAEVEWAGGNKVSGVKTIAHGLGTASIFIAVTAISTPSTSAVARNITATNVDLYAFDFEEAPVKGTKTTLHWIAMS